MKRKVQNVVVVGFGRMGEGIAATFAAAGANVTVVSRRHSQLRDLPDRVSATGALPAAAPDLLVECLPESLQLKTELFTYAASKYGSTTLLASNTSSLPLEDLHEGAPRFVGLHFSHPPDIVPLVEIIRVAHTTDHDVVYVREFLRRCGKQPLVIAKPVLGGLVNRLQHAMLNEAYQLMDHGAVCASDVDLVARELLGPRMSITGLIEQKDLSGLANHLKTQERLVPDLYASQQVADVLKTLVAAGNEGLASGRGFYNWAGIDADKVRRQVNESLQTLIETKAGLPPLRATTSGDRHVGTE